MNSKQIRLDLYNYNVYITQLKNIDLELERVKYEYQGIKGQSFEDNGGGGTNAISRSVENEVLQKERRIDQLMSRRKKVKIDIDRIENGLSTLKELERLVIDERYFKNFEWMDVAENLGYSIQWVKKVDTQALEKLEQVYIDE